MYNNSLISDFLFGRVSVILPSGKSVQIEAPIRGLLSDEDLEFLAKEGEETI